MVSYLVSPNSYITFHLCRTDTLVKHHSGTERTNELRGFAARLEENIFNTADHQVIRWLHNINVYFVSVINIEISKAMNFTT